MGEKQKSTSRFTKAWVILLMVVSIAATISLPASAATKTKKLSGPARLLLADLDSTTFYFAEILFRKAGATVICSTRTKLNPEDYDGLIVPGNLNDVHPKFYKEKVNGAYDFNVKRDIYRFSVIKKFALAGKPIYGICGGIQTINVLFGGSLVQDIKGHMDRQRYVKISPKSINYPLFGKKVMASHMHHVCPKKVAYGFIATEWDVKSKNIEAIQHEKYPIYGVQYHPEFMGKDGIRIAKNFIKICLKYRKKPVKVNRSDFQFIKF